MDVYFSRCRSSGRHGFCIGNESTGEIEAVYTDRIGKHPYSLESEHFLTVFSKNEHTCSGRLWPGSVFALPHGKGWGFRSVRAL